MDKRQQEKPRRIVPPVYMFASIALMVVLDWLSPFGFKAGPLLWGFGGCFISLGVFLDIYCALLFKKANTGIVPFHEATSVVETGPYKITRNPMYVGMVLIQLGVVVILGNLLAFLPLVVFVWIIQKNFIEGEEGYMEATLGQPYIDYKSRVRRWI